MVVPLSGSLTALIVPKYPSTNCLAIASPRPLPPFFAASGFIYTVETIEYFINLFL